MKKIALIVLAATTFSCTQEQQTNTLTIPVNYTDTKKVDTVDTYFGVEVADPYRWLEDDRSEETESWVKRQNEVTYDYLR